MASADKHRRYEYLLTWLEREEKKERKKKNQVTENGGATVNGGSPESGSRRRTSESCASPGMTHLYLR
jgi:hypothetical protein